MTVCPELLGRINSRGRPRRQQIRVVFSRFETLPEEGRGLIQGWLREAEQEKNPFKQFIFTWMAFNGWAECITESNSDREYLHALMQNARLQQAFESLKQNQVFSKLVEEFAGFWPIFKVRDLRRLRIRRWQTPIEHRERLVQEYLANGATKFEPQCWQRHMQNRESPMDWAHTLAALYQVRCNLFHGEKALSSEMDQRIVQVAFGVLFRFLKTLPEFGG